MKDIVEAIKEKRETILRLQAELEVLEKARALLNGSAGVDHSIALHEVMKIKNRRPSVRVRRGHPMKGKVNPKSSVGQTIAVLRESGVALHISEILSRLKKRGSDAKKISLVSTMTRLSKQGRIFYKADQPSTFGLLEWQQAKGA